MMRILALILLLPLALSAQTTPMLVGKRFPTIAMFDNDADANTACTIGTTPGACEPGKWYMVSSTGLMRVVPASGPAGTFVAWPGSAGGDAIAPATNTADFFPQWNGANSKTLKDGLQATDLNVNSTLVKRSTVGDFAGRYVNATQIRIPFNPDGNYAFYQQDTTSTLRGLLGLSTANDVLIGSGTGSTVHGIHLVTPFVGFGIAPVSTLNYYFKGTSTTIDVVRIMGTAGQVNPIFSLADPSVGNRQAWTFTHEKHWSQDIIAWVLGSSGAPGYVPTGGTVVQTGISKTRDTAANGGGSNGGSLAIGNGTQGDITGTIQAGVRAAPPACSVAGDVGNGPVWFDTTTTTTAPKLCVNVAGTMQWMTVGGSSASGWEINCASFGGVDPTETTDSSTGLQNCLNSVPSGRFVIPQGHYRIMSTILQEQRTGMTVIGSAPGTASTPGGTTFHWRGTDPTVPMFRLWGVRDSTFEKISIIAHTPLAEAIRSETHTGFVSSRIVFEDMYIQGVSGLIGIGVRGMPGSGGDNNNEFMIFRNVQVSNYSKAAFSIEHSQAKHWTFQDCTCAGNDIGEMCVDNTINGGGSFTWRGGGGGYNTVAEFKVANPGDVVTIENAGFEGTRRIILATGGIAISEWPLILRSVRVAPKTTGGFDGHLIVFNMGGALQVIGCTFQMNIGGGMNNYAYDIQMNSVNGQLIAIGNHFTSLLTHPYSGAGVANTISLNNTINRANPVVDYTTNIMLPNLLPGSVAVPSTASTACTVGSFAYDASFEYRCVATDTWKRTALATW